MLNVRTGMGHHIGIPISLQIGAGNCAVSVADVVAIAIVVKFGSV